MSTTNTSFAINLAKKDSVIIAVISKLQSSIYVNSGIKVDAPEFQQALYDFLMAKDFAGGINVLLTRTPIFSDTVKLSISDTHYVEVSFGKNNRKDMYPNLLSATICKKPLEVFKTFWKKHDCPACLFDEAVSKLDLYRPISITIFKSPKVWNEYQKMYEKYNLIGQTPREKSGSFVPTIPIGYVNTEKNSVVMTNPELSKRAVCYTFELKVN